LIERTMRTFFRLYDTRGWFQEGLDTLDRAINPLEIADGYSPANKSDQSALGHLLATRAWFGYRLANYEQAQRMLERSLEILRPLNEPHALVESLTYLGRVMEMTGNYDMALELYSEGLETATAIEDPWFKAVCCLFQVALMGLTHTMLKPEVTHKRLQSVVADSRLIGDPRLIAFGLDFLSRSALRLGRYNEARAALEENVALNSSISFGWGLGTAYRALGKVAQAQDEHLQAVDIFRKSLDIFNELGGNWFIARVLAEMGESILTLGNETEARRIWRESLSIATNIHATPVALEALAGFANLRAKQGDSEHALELLSIVLNHPASLQVTKNRASALWSELELQFTRTQIDAIQARVGDKSFDAFVQEFLN
jgi:tetratricopeptide (TPR) repeat protein